MGCCLLVIIGALWPRVALICVYLFTTIPQRVFHETLWPLLGFIFMPTTTLAYELCIVYLGSMNNVWSVVIIILAVLHDLGQFGALRSRRSKA